MSPRIIQLPVSGRDRRHYVRELKAAEQAHHSLTGRVEAAYRNADDHLRLAHRLSCEEWNVRQFIGGDAAPSPTIAEAIAGDRELLEVRCKRCSHESLVDLAEVVWPRGNQVHTLANVLRCRRCLDERKKPQTDLVSLRQRNPAEPSAPARRQRAG